jgi:hypothetical protein
MARSKAVATAAGGTQALTTLDQELSQSAIALRSAIGGPVGKAIKVKPTGNFILPDGFDLGSEFQCVVVDFVSKNMFYSGPYNPDNPAPPDCYAANKVIAEMAPDAESPAAQADNCAECPLNRFGSGNNGKSKACKNTRELAVLLIDAENPNAHLDPDAPLYTLSLSPTALRSFDGFVANAIRTLNGPPIKAIVTVAAQNAGTYAAVTFHDMVPNPHYAQHAARRAEAAELLARKPNFTPRQATRQSARPAPRRAGAAPVNRPAMAAGGRR